VQPTAGANLPVGAVTFQWASLPGATSYQLRICLTSGCSGGGLVTSDTVTTTSFQRSLVAGGYTASVLAYQGTTLLAQSEERPFSVDDFCAGRFGVGDFNGDGRTDRLCSAEGTTRVSLATPGGFATPAVWLAQELPKTLVGDFDGNGLADLANFDNSVGGEFYVLSPPARASPASLCGIAMRAAPVAARRCDPVGGLDTQDGMGHDRGTTDPSWVVYLVSSPCPCVGAATQTGEGERGDSNGSVVGWPYAFSSKPGMDLWAGVGPSTRRLITFASSARPDAAEVSFTADSGGETWLCLVEKGEFKQLASET
jgi:hypothetical protein